MFEATFPGSPPQVRIVLGTCPGLAYGTLNGHCARWVPFAHLTEKEAEALRWKGLGKGHLAPVVDSPYSGAKWASGCPRQLQTGTGHGHVPSTPTRMKL